MAQSMMLLVGVLIGVVSAVPIVLVAKRLKATTQHPIMQSALALLISAVLMVCTIVIMVNRDGGLVAVIAMILTFIVLIMCYGAFTVWNTNKRRG